MIPKKLHYIWLGGNKTELTKKCINSFHKFLPDYEIIEWNESNINIEDFLEETSLFYKECYDKKNMLFVQI